jgi:hypothetical protein
MLKLFLTFAGLKWHPQGANRDQSFSWMGLSKASGCVLHLNDYVNMRVTGELSGPNLNERRRLMV